ncbi:hypothetical protein [Coleofasciculus sp. E1-EBD-02]|jgi:hypothetical protein|uniref:hypothetical protein n=1 Tax=Coleofasciculus sp. E1-EBD-02 TaxID=3068481 RepID=UPI0032F94148
MNYTFDILGVSPILDFFNHQQRIGEKVTPPGVEYLGTYQCTLDAFLESVETVPTQKGWNMDRAVDTVIQFWMNHPDRIRYWKDRLEDAGNASVLVSRIADMPSLKAQFNSLFKEK